MRALQGLVLLLALSAPTGAWAQKSEESDAGDVSEVDKDALGPLRERIRPVSGHIFLKKGRFELTPSASVSIKDAFFTKYLFGISATYHLGETFGFGLRYAYSLPVVSGGAQICVTDDTGTVRTCRSPTVAELSGNAPGQLNMLGGLDVYWSPIFGKLSLSAETFLHFDMYAVIGPTAVFYTGPSAAGAPEQKITVGGNLGVGFRIFVTRWFALKTELRDVIYVEQVQPLPATALRNQIVFELGFSFFLPTNFAEN